MTPDLDNWEELRPIIEDGELRFSGSDPERLVLKLAPELEVDWSLSTLVDDVMDHIETHREMDNAAELAAVFDKLSKRIRRTLRDMEGS